MEALLLRLEDGLNNHNVVYMGQLEKVRKGGSVDEEESIIVIIDVGYVPDACRMRW